MRYYGYALMVSRFGVYSGAVMAAGRPYLQSIPSKPHSFCICTAVV